MPLRTDKVLQVDTGEFETGAPRTPAVGSVVRTTPWSRPSEADRTSPDGLVREPGLDVVRHVAPAIRVPHPLECRRRRPARAPRWVPSPARSRPDEIRRSTLEAWREPRLEAAADTGPLRIRFSYDAWFTTTAGYSTKARRAVYHEGATETAAWIEAEASTRRLDLRFQPVRVVWRRDHGSTRHLTLDAGFENEDGSIEFSEYKAHPTFLEQANTVDLLDEAEEVLAKEGAGLVRATGVELLDAVRLKAHGDVFFDRATPYDDGHVHQVLEAIEAAGGTAPLGRVLEALGGWPRLASAKLNAMSVRRIVRIDLSAPQMPDTPVDVPAPVIAGRLHRFLRRHAAATATAV